MTIILQQREMIVAGFPVLLDVQLGHLMVSHDGAITWDQLQAIKNEVWGRDARAIEVYPAQDDLVNSGNWRHLWRLGRFDFCPDLLGAGLPHEGTMDAPDGLYPRFVKAWAEALEVFR